MGSDLFYFNGVDPQTGAYGRQPAALNQLCFEGSGRAASLEPRELGAHLNPNRLEQVGWAVLLHEEESPDTLEALKPLIRHRSEQMGKEVEVITLTHEICHNRPGEGPDGAAMRFLSQRAMPAGVILPERLPYYLLIVGSPHLIPFAFQSGLGTIHATGRLHLPSAGAYAAYAQKILEREQSPVAAASTMALFSAENDPLTSLVCNRLSRPLAEQLQQARPDWKIASYVGGPARKSQLRQLLEGPDTPSILFTAGHGAYFSRNAQKRPAAQGSLVCSDWPGPGHKAADEHMYCATDVGKHLNMRETIAFFFACFSAGTPRLDSFAPDNPNRLHEQAFSAALPMTLLVHPKGPPALFGHVDQTFEGSFLWDHHICDTTHFMSLFFKLMEGERIGEAMTPLRRRFARVAVEIARRIMTAGPDQKLRLQYWTAWQDARSFAILGDPAVCLHTKEAAS